MGGVRLGAWPRRTTPSNPSGLPTPRPPWEDDPPAQMSEIVKAAMRRGKPVSWHCAHGHRGKSGCSPIFP